MTIRTNTRKFDLDADITYEATPTWKYVIHMTVRKGDSILHYYVSEYHNHNMTNRTLASATRIVNLVDRSADYAERFALNAEMRPAAFLRWYFSTPLFNVTD